MSLFDPVPVRIGHFRRMVLQSDATAGQRVCGVFTLTEEIFSRKQGVDDFPIADQRDRTTGQFVE